MDFSSILGSLMGSDTIKNVGQLTGAGEKDVTSVFSSVLPSLLSGAKDQAKNENTAASFATALSNHGAKDSSDLSSFIGGLDLVDGDKIVSHLLGGNSSSVANNVSAQTGVSSEKTSQIMSAAAPLLMNLLGQKAASNQSQKPAASGITGILGGLFDDDDDEKGGLDFGSIIKNLL